MQGQITMRLFLSLTSAGGAGLVWALAEAGQRGRIGDYAALTLIGLVLTWTGGVLAMAAALGPRRAAARALGLAVVAGGLVALTKLRYGEAEAYFDTPLPLLAGLATAVLPVPFLIASVKSRWNDYSTLFHEAWGLVLRGVAALTFCGLVFLVLFLSDAVLGIVGIGIIGKVLGHDLGLMLIAGAAIGLGMAVLDEAIDIASPQILVRILRLFLPIALAVMVIFLVALPVRGLDGLTGGLSPALILLVMLGAGITLTSITVDKTDAEAAQSPALIRAAQGMALVLPVFAGLVLWALWLRVGQHGLSPGRIFVLTIGLLGLGYGVGYAIAVLRGAGWMERIRQANVRMVLVVITLAVLWQTPVLNAEALAARNQLARYLDGRSPAETLDLSAIARWGKPGARVLAEFQALAAQPGHEALAKALEGGAALPEPPADLAKELAAVMPVQPATATGTRDSLLPAVESWQLSDWLQVCTRPGDGPPPCLMVVADLMPAVPGEEALVILDRGPDYVELAGLYLDSRGRAQYRSFTHPDGRPVTTDEARKLLEAARQAPLPVSPAELNQLGTGGDGLVILP